MLLMTSQQTPGSSIASPSPPTAGAGGARDRVLLVDDDGRIRRALSLALDDEGFTVVTAPSGEEALGALGSARVDLVLLDLMLPGVDGLTV
jgi:CheY-like chemotaxis protein